MIYDSYGYSYYSFLKKWIPMAEKLLHHPHDECGCFSQFSTDFWWFLNIFAAYLAPHSHRLGGFNPPEANMFVFFPVRMNTTKYNKCQIIFQVTNQIIIGYIPIYFHSIPMISTFSKVHPNDFGSSDPYWSTPKSAQLHWGRLSELTGLCKEPRFQSKHHAVPHVPPPFDDHFCHGIWI